MEADQPAARDRCPYGCALPRPHSDRRSAAEMPERPEPSEVIHSAQAVVGVTVNAMRGTRGEHGGPASANLERAVVKSSGSAEFPPLHSVQRSPARGSPRACAASESTAIPG